MSVAVGLDVPEGAARKGGRRGRGDDGGGLRIGESGRAGRAGEDIVNFSDGGKEKGENMVNKEGMEGRVLDSPKSEREDDQKHLYTFENLPLVN